MPKAIYLLHTSQAMYPGYSTKLSFRNTWERGLLQLKNGGTNHALPPMYYESLSKPWSRVRREYSVSRKGRLTYLLRGWPLLSRLVLALTAEWRTVSYAYFHHFCELPLLLSCEVRKS